MKRILLIRHGQTDWNSQSRWQGHLDVPLNDEGVAQAQALAKYLSTRPITAVYSSDLMRAQATATAIAQGLGLTVKTDARWRELNLGIFQGLTTTEINGKYPEESRLMREDYMDYPIPDGETRRAMQVRTYEAFREIVAQEAGPEIAVVAHGGTIRVLIMKLFDDVFAHTSIHNTSITIVESDGTVDKLVEAAVTPHLIE